MNNRPSVLSHDHYQSNTKPIQCKALTSSIGADNLETRQSTDRTRMLSLVFLFFFFGKESFTAFNLASFSAARNQAERHMKSAAHQGDSTNALANNEGRF